MVWMAGITDLTEDVKHSISPKICPGEIRDAITCYNFTANVFTTWTRLLYAGCDLNSPGPSAHVLSSALCLDYLMSVQISFTFQGACIEILGGAALQCCPHTQIEYEYFIFIFFLDALQCECNRTDLSIMLGELLGLRNEDIDVSGSPLIEIMN